MPTNRRRIPRSMKKLTLHPLELQYLFFGEFLGPIPHEGMTGEIFMRGYGPTRRWRELWFEHRDAVLDEWKRQYPEGLPWAAKVWEETDAH
jgi:hypothetical protein